MLSNDSFLNEDNLDSLISKRFKIIEKNRNQKFSLELIEFNDEFYSEVMKIDTVFEISSFLELPISLIDRLYKLIGYTEVFNDKEKYIKCIMYLVKKFSPKDQWYIEQISFENNMKYTDRKSVV